MIARVLMVLLVCVSGARAADAPWHVDAAHGGIITKTSGNYSFTLASFSANSTGAHTFHLVVSGNVTYVDINAVEPGGLISTFGSFSYDYDAWADALSNFAYDPSWESDYNVNSGGQTLSVDGRAGELVAEFEAYVHWFHQGPFDPETNQIAFNEWGNFLAGSGTTTSGTSTTGTTGGTTGTGTSGGTGTTGSDTTTSTGTTGTGTTGTTTTGGSTSTTTTGGTDTGGSDTSGTTTTGTTTTTTTTSGTTTTGTTTTGSSSTGSSGTATSGTPDDDSGIISAIIAFKNANHEDLNTINNSINAFKDQVHADHVSEQSALDNINHDLSDVGDVPDASITEPSADLSGSATKANALGNAIGSNDNYSFSVSLPKPGGETWDYTLSTLPEPGSAVDTLRLMIRGFLLLMAYVAFFLACVRVFKYY